MNRPPRLTRVALVAVAATALSTGFVSAAAADDDEPFDVLASGLDNPRHLQFGSDGVLYVAESGRGGDQACATSPEGAPACYGATGAVTAIGGDGEQRRVVTGLPSFASDTGAEAIGPSDVAPTRDGLLVTVGLGRDPAARAELPAEFRLAGWLVEADPQTGASEGFADIAGFEGSANPDGEEPDSNPNAVLARKGGAVVVDAGGNSLLTVSAEGEVSLRATFPGRPQTVGVQVPDGPPVGAQIPAQAVPTSVARGDGAYYVGELTGFPFAKGGAQVDRVEGGEVSVRAAGFTNVVDVEVVEDTLYVLELAKDGLLATPPGQVPVGRLVRVVGDGEPEVVAELPAPGGLAIKGSTAYVTTNSTSAGAGEVVAVPLAD